MSYILAQVDTLYIQAISSNFYSVLPRFRDITAQVLWTATFIPNSYPPEIWIYCPWTRLIILAVAEGKDPRLYV